jgi:hypothetical protein
MIFHLSTVQKVEVDIEVSLLTVRSKGMIENYRKDSHIIDLFLLLFELAGYFIHFSLEITVLQLP